MKGGEKMGKNVKNKTVLSSLFIIMLMVFTTFSANADDRTVLIGGEAFGLKLYCKGVMITKLDGFSSENGDVCPAEQAGLKQNDIITAVNGNTIKTNDELSDAVKNSNGKELVLTVLRDGKTKTIRIKPQKSDDKNFYTGIWVRDSCAGLGTISYYDTKSMTYGALGHGICDIDTGSIIESDEGEILPATISSVTKSKNNDIGTLNGYFQGMTIGSMTENSPLGIFGKLRAYPEKDEIYTIADKSEVKTGSAELITTLSGTKPQRYEIEITDINNDYKNSNTNLTVKITDKRLLDKTGGIVQGMSGSPIIQNGKFAAALTHVFLDDCKSGYAILAQNLVKE